MQPLLWRVREQFPRSAHVVEVTPVARRMRRIRLGGPSLRGLPWMPGQQLRVRLTPTIFMRDSLRTYSVWRYDAATGLLDLCVLLHGDAPGARWAAAVRPGDEVTFWGPRGSFVVDPAADFHLFAGEETAAVAIQAMTDALPSGVPAWVRLEADTPDDELPAAARDGVDLRWVHRRGAPASPASGLVDAVRALALPAGAGTAYVAGEAMTCRAVRDHLVRERGWPRQRVRVKPFWMLGKRGLE